MTHDVAKPETTKQADGGQQALDAWLRSNEVLFAGTFELARQCLAVSQTRLAEDFHILRVIAGCRDLNEIVDCQKRFAAKASKEYPGYAHYVTSRLGALLAAGRVETELPPKP